MTRQLLTALLVAAVSATAQAEQWLCKGEQAASHVNSLDGPKVHSVVYVLEINRSEQWVKTKGDFRVNVWNDPSHYGHSVMFGEGYIVRAGGWSRSLELAEDGGMVLTDIVAGGIVKVVFAKCKRL